MSNHIAAIVGAILGIATGGYLIVYLPMQANIEHHGCPWLVCPPAHERTVE